MHTSLSFLGLATVVFCTVLLHVSLFTEIKTLLPLPTQQPPLPTPDFRGRFADFSRVSLVWGLDVIRKEAWPSYRTISGVRLSLKWRCHQI